MAEKKFKHEIEMYISDIIDEELSNDFEFENEKKIKEVEVVENNEKFFIKILKKVISFFKKG